MKFVYLFYRIKEIDWIPYLTTRLVDDAASHLRLFKQARAKVKALEKHKTPKNSPHRDLNRSPKRTHKRNKSETDVRYYGRKCISETKGSPISIYRYLDLRKFILQSYQIPSAHRVTRNSTTRQRKQTPTHWRTTSSIWSAKWKKI